MQIPTPIEIRQGKWNFDACASEVQRLQDLVTHIQSGFEESVDKRIALESQVKEVEAGRETDKSEIQRLRDGLKCIAGKKTKGLTPCIFADTILNPRK